MCVNVDTPHGPMTGPPAMYRPQALLSAMVSVSSNDTPAQGHATAGWCPLTGAPALIACADRVWLRKVPRTPRPPKSYRASLRSASYEKPSEPDSIAIARGDRPRGLQAEAPSCSEVDREEKKGWEV